MTDLFLCTLLVSSRNWTPTIVTGYWLLIVLSFSLFFTFQVSNYSVVSYKLEKLVYEMKDVNGRFKIMWMVGKKQLINI